MSKIFVFLIFLFVVTFVAVENCWAAPVAAASTAQNYAAPHEQQWGINLYLPSLQFRFQDGDNQTRSLHTGYSLSAGLEFQNTFQIALEYNMMPAESSGNNSLSVESKYTELNLAAAYNVWRWDLQKKLNTNYFSIWGVGYLGQGQTKVNTTLLGNTTEDTSAAELSMGLGVMGQYRYKFFLVEIDTRLMTSKLYEPQTLSVTSLRLGLQVGW